VKNDLVMQRPAVERMRMTHYSHAPCMLVPRIEQRFQPPRGSFEEE
jgi:hypothetical protein